jgi:carbamoyl-phosphate synthase large subunit
MEIVHGDKDLERYMREAVRVSDKIAGAAGPLPGGRVEVDVDCISDGEDVLIGGIMEHIEAAGMHSGDSACSLPPYTLAADLQDELRRQTADGPRAQGGRADERAVRHHRRGQTRPGGLVYVLEVNPRASRTVPFVSKATGQPLAKIAARCMAGQLF